MCLHVLIIRYRLAGLSNKFLTESRRRGWPTNIHFTKHGIFSDTSWIMVILSRNNRDSYNYSVPAEAWHNNYYAEQKKMPRAVHIMSECGSYTTRIECSASNRCTVPQSIDPRCLVTRAKDLASSPGHSNWKAGSGLGMRLPKIYMA